MTERSASPFKNGTLLAGFGLLAAALLAGTWLFTSDLIFDQQRRHLLRQLEGLLPADYDNDPLDDVVYLQDAARLGQTGPVAAYRARRGEEVVAVMYQVVAPDGYSGPIRLLLGINMQGELLGVRTIEHKETPGLGDFIELRRSDWMHHFDGRSLSDPAPEGWTVARDGGAFDQITGATVTARAVTHAVALGLQTFAEQRDYLLSAAAQPEPEGQP